MSADMDIVKAITERLNRHGYKGFRVTVNKSRTGRLLIDIIHNGVIPSYLIRLIGNSYSGKRISVSNIVIHKDTFDEPAASGESGSGNG